MKPPDFVRFGRAICCDLEQARRREWWMGNGLGGYAGGTIAQCLTRRYHGLLITPAHPPLGRLLVFAKADATLHDQGRKWPLFTNCWGSGAIEPQGLIHIESFRLDGSMPVWRFAIGDLVVEQCICLEPKQETVCVAWRLAHAMERPVHLGVDLLVNCRSHHGETHQWEFTPEIEGGENHISITHGGGRALHFHTHDGQLFRKRQWIVDFDLPRERERGLPDRDSHLCAAHMRLPLGTEWNGVIATTKAGSEDGFRPSCAEMLDRRRAHDTAGLMMVTQWTQELCDAPGWVHQLVIAADSFPIVRPVPAKERKEGTEEPDRHAERGESIIAGYPWFGDWGRDTMIALPGLTLTTGRYASARNILAAFAGFVDRGMLPNMFPDDGGQPQYNTADGALWYFEAWMAYIAASHDTAALREIYPLLCEMIDWHVRGTRHGICADPNDGLLRAGEPGVQLTWMDAKLGGWVVTPRQGKPVEINALWFNALECMAKFSRLLEKDPEIFETLAKRTHAGFTRFLKAAGGLYDVLDGPEGNDESVRPNQILAVTLRYSPLSPEAQAQVVADVKRHLLTSYGLRSLAPEHPAYRGHYQGGVWERDSAYHQGPVWSWLLPQYALAEYRVTGNAELAQSRLAPIRDHLLDAGLGTISEIFDGEPPHAPRGAPSQAWSVACVLEAWVKLERARAVATESTDKQEE
ncbi:amylo-alpha-1,6-glucosidase [Nitrosospira briensis]|uniref:amylo-alpha-1,6-glucosidase n=1 Tax=Nitrosospira briensis TaxID=35799 RepID=UPI0008E3124A|nr:amylo-alpha-1,6-glucosidase [Nitrosospira briensis]SFO04821.1 4-alpha-glucanotransferase [Nitrosospira briensis]